VGLASLATLVALVAAWVVSCLWLLQVRDNARLIRPPIPQRRGAAWVWLGWWVPIASFFVPFQVVRDVLDGSDQLGPGTRRPRFTGAILGWWWAAWLVTLVLGRVESSLLDSVERGATSAAAVQGVAGVNIVATLVGLALWCLLVQRIIVRQRTAAPLR
jgi:hypothetical protein